MRLPRKVNRMQAPITRLIAALLLLHATGASAASAPRSCERSWTLQRFEHLTGLRTRQQELHIVVGPSTPIARMLAISGLDRTYRAHATVEDA